MLDPGADPPSQFSPVVQLASSPSPVHVALTGTGPTAKAEVQHPQKNDKNKMAKVIFLIARLRYSFHKDP